MAVTIAIMDLPVRFYSINIQFVGFTTLLILTFIFKDLVETYEVLTKRVPRALRAQKSKNVELQTDATYNMSEKEKAKLDAVNKRIDALISTVSDSSSISLFGLVPMTKANILRLLGGILAALGSSLIRITLG